MSAPALALPAPAEPTRVRSALASAARDFWHQSWRLALLNSALSLAALAVAVGVAYSPFALILVPMLGSLAAALAHCTVTLARTSDLRLAHAVEGLRLHWFRGLELALLAAVVVGAGTFAIAFYASARGAAWPLAFLVGYLLAAFALLQLHLWPLAAAAPEANLRALLALAVSALLRRPGATLRLALVLLVVNLLGVAAAVMPFLTLTVSYSFLAAAHFALPREQAREV